MKKRLLCTILIPVALAGCGHRQDSEELMPLADTVLADVPYKEAGSEAVSVNYAVPENKPRIRSDLMGYQPEDEKYAVIIGGDIAEKFALLNAADLSEAYSGSLRQRGADEGIYRADFGEYTKPGEYLLYNESVGYSYPVLIGEGMYTAWLDAYLSALNDAELTNPVSGAAILMNMLQVAEFDPQDYTQLAMELKPAAEWLLDLMDASGAVSASDSQEATLLSAVALGRMSALISAEDKAFSNECLAAAELAYKWLAGRRMSIDDAAWYMINAELLKDSGKDIYKNELNELFKNGNPRKSGEYIGRVDPVYWGDVAYMSAAKGADRASCDAIIAEYMSRARDISEAVSGDPYLTSEREDMAALLEDARLLAWVNGVITNREYRDAMKELLHYLGGRNPQAESYVTERGVLCNGAEAGSDDELYYGSMLAIVLSRIDLRYVQAE